MLFAGSPSCAAHPPCKSVRVHGGGVNEISYQLQGRFARAFDVRALRRNSPLAEQVWLHSIAAHVIANTNLCAPTLVCH